MHNNNRHATFLKISSGGCSVRGKNYPKKTPIDFILFKTLIIIIIINDCTCFRIFRALCFVGLSTTLCLILKHHDFHHDDNFLDKIRDIFIIVFKTLALAKHPGGITDSGVDHFLMVVQ